MGMKESIDLAGMSTPQGRLGNPAPPGYIMIPGSIELDSQDMSIHWNNPVRFRKVKPPEDLIAEFVGLFDADPVIIADFARRRGVLGIRDDGSFIGCFYIASGLERIEHWRVLASQVRSILELAAAVLGDTETVTARARRLDDELREWLYRFPSTIGFEREKRDKQIELRIHYDLGLPSVIAFQLLQVVARRSVYFCSECKNPFVRRGGSNLERRPKSGMDRFCDCCGHSAAARRADERRRGRVAEARRLDADGMPLAEIISKLGVKRSATVLKWIKHGK